MQDALNKDINKHVAMGTDRVRQRSADHDNTVFMPFLK